MSSQVDDEEPYTPPGTDNDNEDNASRDLNNNDRSHRVRLGDTVTVTFDPEDDDEAPVSATATTGADGGVKTVVVKPVRIRHGGVPDGGVMPLQLTSARELLAQVGVRLNEAEGYPTTVDDQWQNYLVDGQFRVHDNSFLTGNAWDLIDNFGTTQGDGATDDIHVFIVPHLYGKRNPDSPWKPIAGFAVMSDCVAPEESRYRYNLFISATADFATLAHELGHLLGENRHFYDKKYLTMYYRECGDTFGNRRRLTEDERAAIRGDDHVM